jgi:triosephosphate isomerase (TIM)
MKKLIAANWKMNKTIAESVSTAREIKSLIKEGDADVLICPPFTSLQAVHKELKGSSIKLGAQNMHFEEKGAYTGDISPLMVKDAGCEYVILGHSERREFFHEDNALINKKVFSALMYSLSPILCIGETFEQKEKNTAKKIIESQLREGLKGISKDQMADVTVAYEPVWAISRGNPNIKPATKEDAQSAHKFIREIISNLYDAETAKNTRILYGGSMKPENAKELLSLPDVDGGLVGNASLDAKSFAEIIKHAE